MVYQQRTSQRVTVPFQSYMSFIASAFARLQCRAIALSPSPAAKCALQAQTDLPLQVTLSLALKGRFPSPLPSSEQQRFLLQRISPLHPLTSEKVVAAYQAISNNFIIEGRDFFYLFCLFIYMTKLQYSQEDQSSQESVHLTKLLPDFRNRDPLQTPSHLLLINLSDCQYDSVRLVTKELGFKLSFHPQAVDWDIYWTDSYIDGELLMKMYQHQKVSHFPGIQNLTRKNLMGKTLMRMRKSFEEQFDFIPLTWMLPAQYNQFRLYFQTKPKKKARTYIVKPESGCQGKGIFLTRSIEDLEDGRHMVVQRYLTKPLLIDGLKFDLRLYLLITSVHPLSLFIFNDGLARFATRRFQIPTDDNLSQLFMHLTNYAINKANPAFIYNKSDTKTNIGHKRSFQSVLEILRRMGHNTNELVRKIEDILVKGVISCLPPIAHQYKAYQPQNLSSDMCFQIIGADILLNDKCEPILLQFNHTPSFATDTPLDRRVKKAVIKETIKLLGLNLPRKERLLREKQEQIKLRNLSTKKVKISQEEKLGKREYQIAKRMSFQDLQASNFRRIYPSSDPELAKKYDKFAQFSDKHYMETAGFKRRFEEPIKQTPQNKDYKIRSAVPKLTTDLKRDASKSQITQPFQRSSRLERQPRFTQQIIRNLQGPENVRHIHTHTNTPHLQIQPSLIHNPMLGRRKGNQFDYYFSGNKGSNHDSLKRNIVEKVFAKRESTEREIRKKLQRRGWIGLGTAQQMLQELALVPHSMSIIQCHKRKN